MDIIGGGGVNTEKRLSVELSFIPVFNFALQQNAFPVVHELKLNNNTECDLPEIECSFSSEPRFIVPKTVMVESLSAGEALPLHNLDLELDYGFFATLPETLKSKLRLEVRSGGKLLLMQEYEVETVAPDQWLGIGVLPELLCAFVTPNLEIVNQLQADVAGELEKSTGSAAIQGYQAGKARVYEICSAIYRVIHGWGIRYSNPASSFGTPGQRVRFTDAIYKYRLATCLDTTLLFASTMEQCGLHPVIMLQKGHAYIGCHLVDRYFPDIPMDDLQTIRKLADLDEFLVIETTMVAGNASFQAAETAAMSEHLNVDEDFHCAIDVIRARYSGIRPLPIKHSTDGIEFAPIERNVSPLGASSARQLQSELDISKLEDSKARNGRVSRWTQKLLDLSLRNRLLNVRDTKQVIPVACSNIAQLEDKIAADETLSLHPLDNLLSEKDVHDMAMLRTNEVKSEIKALLDKELGQHRLWTLLSPPEMNKRLTGLYRQSRTDLEEGGVNTLFLAIGFLEWKMSECDAKSYLAPILLIPIRMQRKSIAEGIRISRIDEDTVLNETLMELLRSQFQLTVPGLSPLPTDDSGVDVGKILQIFRQTVKNMKGWEVREDARIGHFSFGKYLMWNDMTARVDALRQNQLVDHLIGGGGIFDDGIEVFDQAEIKNYIDIKNLYCPVSADSSQLAAVLYSQMGKSFVLHGPPGTGKSQTITNIIAHNLAIGRRVLFVSEKKAALEVVHKRLSAIGLRPFCLELHSNKSGKAEVLTQFAEALNVPETEFSSEWEATADAMLKLRSELNEYVSALHRIYPNGLSAYDCFSRLMMDAEKVPDGLLQIDCLAQDRSNLESARQIVADLSNAWCGTNMKAVKALSRLDVADWSPVFEREMLAAARELLVRSEELAEKFRAWANWLFLNDNCSMQRIFNTAALAETLKGVVNIPASLICDDFAAKMEFIKKFNATAVRYEQLQEKLHNYQLNIMAALDVSKIKARLNSNGKVFWLVRFLRNRALVKELAGVKKLGGGKLTLNELVSLLPDAQEYIVVSREYCENEPGASALLGKLWNGGKPDWDKLRSIFEQTRTILESIDNIVTDETGREPCLEMLRTILPDAEKIFAKSSDARTRINDFLLAWNEFQEKLQAFSKYGTTLAGGSDLLELIGKIGQIVAYGSDLRGVMRYRKIRLAAKALGVGKIAESIEAGMLAPERLDSVFDFAYGKEMLEQILATSQVLCNFTGLNQEERIRKFCELDDRYMKLAHRIIFAKLAASLPRRRSGPCPEGTELGILKRECEKRARLKPVRQLLEQIPTLAAILKPCFLMSPLSVAQYLPPDTAPFDLIVFDEASQIPVWDAIGVIARGRQLIVVGDPKQMPPTNFFQKEEAENSEPLPNETDDMESILDECLAAGVHSSYLNWHYRSRHESLIAFSNHYYYDDRLFTFPAARSSDRLGVKFRFVPDGTYARRSTRTNRIEAKALVDYVFARLNDPNSNKRSIGIVTFSLPQRDLIEDLLEQRRVDNPQLESYFSDQNEEPPFVKNLESVQGDERDVILFSIGYAPDEDGKFSMNFGPLNRQGGERRLNVAITRAKEQVVVFSSIRASQIELARTSAVGAAHLKYFLDYAEKGFHIQTKAGDVGGRSCGMAAEIADFLTDKGFSVASNVGCSGYRIDLAVRHPERPAEFMLGIESDGVSYSSQRTTRDRDHLRGSVLRSLGWHTYRAWSIDWAFDRNQAEARLLETIEKIMRTPDVPVLEISSDTPATEPVSETGFVSESEVPARQVAAKNVKTYSIWSKTCGLPQYQFYEIGSRDLIRRQMLEVVEMEAPIYEGVLMKRIVAAWGFNRTGESILNILTSCFPDNLEITKIGEDRVLWAQGRESGTYRAYRVAASNEARRTIDEIPPEELANAMYEILIDFNSCELDTLYRETIKLFGFSAVTSKARKYLDFGMEALRHSGRI